MDAFEIRLEILLCKLTKKIMFVYILPDTYYEREISLQEEDEKDKNHVFN